MAPTARQLLQLSCANFFPAHDINSSIFQYIGLRPQEGYMGDFASKYSAHPQQVSPTGGQRMLHDTDFACNFQCILRSVNVEHTVDRGMESIRFRCISIRFPSDFEAAQQCLSRYGREGGAECRMCEFSLLVQYVKSLSSDLWLQRLGSCFN